MFSHYYLSRTTIPDYHCTDQHSWRNAWLLALMKFSSKVTTTLFSVAGRAPVGRKLNSVRRSEWTHSTTLGLNFPSLSPLRADPTLFQNLGGLEDRICRIHRLPWVFKVWILYSIFRDPCGSKKYCSYYNDSVIFSHWSPSGAASCKLHAVV